MPFAAIQRPCNGRHCCGRVQLPALLQAAAGNALQAPKLRKPACRRFLSAALGPGTTWRSSVYAMLCCVIVNQHAVGAFLLLVHPCSGCNPLMPAGLAMWAASRTFGARTLSRSWKQRSSGVPRIFQGGHDGSSGKPACRDARWQPSHGHGQACSGAGKPRSLHPGPSRSIMHACGTPLRILQPCDAPLLLEAHPACMPPACSEPGPQIARGWPASHT